MTGTAATAESAKTISLVSGNDTAAQGDRSSDQPHVSADGRYVAFVSSATNLVPGDTNGRADLFVRDRVAQTTVRVNVSSTGGQSTGTVGANGKGGVDLSGNGRVVAFNTDAALVPEDTNNTYDAYVRDLDAGLIERVSVSGAKSGSSASDISVSSEGRYVAFVSSQLAANSTRVDVLRADRVTDAVAIVSVRHPMVPADTRVGGSAQPSISGDGRFVAYLSAAADQVLGDTNSSGDIFVRDMTAATTTRVSVLADGTQVASGKEWPAISETGRYVTFLASSPMASTDSNTTADYVLKDTVSGDVTQLSIGPNGASGVGLNTDDGPAPVSADGRFVAFMSRGALAGVSLSQAYLRDTDAGTTEVVSAGGNGIQGSVDLSASGDHVVWRSPSTNLTPEATNGFLQILMAHYDRDTTPTDSTPPVVIPQMSPTHPDGNNGWFHSEVILTWQVTDPESVATTEGCNEQRVNTDLRSTTFSCTATSAGGVTGPMSVAIARDATPPTVNAQVVPNIADGENGWYVSAPTVSWECTDGTSGIASCAATETVPEGAASTLVGTAEDVAGNEGRNSAGPFNVDLTDPVATCQPAALVYLNGTGEISADISDQGSGPVIRQVTTPADTTRVGARTAVLTGTDVAGRSSSTLCAYRVQYLFSGFNAPVSADEVNVIKAGSTVPLKWTLHDATQEPVANLNSVQLRVTTVSCDPDAEEDPITETASGASGLQYLGDGNYQYNWKTAKTYAASCRTLSVDLGEGASRTVQFRFTR
jgi:hypothetical protein